MATTPARNDNKPTYFDPRLTNVDPEKVRAFNESLKVSIPKPVVVQTSDDLLESKHKEKLEKAERDHKAEVERIEAAKVQAKHEAELAKVEHEKLEKAKADHEAAVKAKAKADEEKVKHETEAKAKAEHEAEVKKFEAEKQAKAKADEEAKKKKEGK